VPARDRLRVQPESLTRHPVLELEWEEAVGLSRQHRGRHIRPARERARLLEGDLGLVPLMLGAGGRDLRRHVVEEVGLQVERLGIATGAGRTAPRRLGARVLPPLAGSLARQRDHGVEQHEPLHGGVLAHGQRREGAHRLAGDHELVTALRRRKGDLDVAAQAHIWVVRG
jgi:hypothetical protein